VKLATLFIVVNDALCFRTTMEHSNRLDWAEETPPDNTVGSNESRKFVLSGKLVGRKRHELVSISSTFVVLLDAFHLLVTIQVPVGFIHHLFLMIVPLKVLNHPLWWVGCI
jgi:hypothetical protein